MQGTELRIIFGRRVKARRIEKHLTQQALADLLGVSQPYIAQVEAGGISASIDTFAKFAEALGTSPSQLVTTEEIFSPIPS